MRIMDFIKGFDRDQLIMMDFESNVALDSWARVVDWFVDVLPMEELGFSDVLNSEGRPPYKSEDLLKLFLYGYKKSLRSSYKLEEACKINLEVIWLLKGLRPSARKIAYFRKENSKAFKQSFRYFVLMLKEMDLISGETIAIDSFKIRAQNSLKNNFNQKKIDQHIDYIDNKLKTIIRKATCPELSKRYKSASEFMNALYRYKAKAIDWVKLDDEYLAINNKETSFRIYKTRKGFEVERTVKSGTARKMRNHDNTLEKINELIIND